MSKNWANILPVPEFMILHETILRYPEGSQLSHLDPHVQVLIEAGYIKQKGHLYYPTEAGVKHAMPKRHERPNIIQVRN